MIGFTEFDAGALDKRFFGVVAGLVEERQDALGRIKVRFSWYGESEVSEWCQVVYPQGVQSVPEEGMQVLVAFYQGDMRMPLVLGVLYGEQDPPPVEQGVSKVWDERVWRTRTGHLLRLRDDEEDLRIDLQTQGGQALRLRDSGGGTLVAETQAGVRMEMTSDQLTLSTPSGQQVVLGRDGTLTLKSPTVKLETSLVDFGSAHLEGDYLTRLKKTFDTHTHQAPDGTTSPPKPLMRKTLAGPSSS